MLKGTAGRIAAIAGPLFIAAALWFLFSSVQKGVDEAGGLGNLLRFHPPLLALATVPLAVHIMLAGLSWKMATKPSGGHLAFSRAFSIHYLSQLGKYVPGKVWATMGKYWLSRYSGLTPPQVGQGLVLETIFIVLGSLMTAIPLMPVVAGQAGLGAVAGVGLAVLLSGCLLLSVHPVFFGRLAAVAARMMKTEPCLRRCRFREMILLVPVYFLVFLFLGVAYWMLCLSFGLTMPFFPGAFVYPAAMGIGYLAIFAPGGLGARELTTVWLVRLIAPETDPGLAELTALVARLWITAAEAISLGVSFPLMGIKVREFKTMLSGKGLPDGNTLQGNEGENIASRSVLSSSQCDDP
jgi:glycosyltransferase 2 family protein